MTENEFILADRLGAIRDTIRKYGEENFYISFSGGKDSTVVHHLVDMALPNNKIPRVFSNTGIEYNAIVEFVREIKRDDSRFVMIQPSKSIKKTLEEKGYPFKSKQFSEVYHTYMSHQQEVRELIEKLNAEPSLKYDYDFVHNLPKNTKYVIKEYFGLREDKDRIYQFQSGCPTILRHMFYENHNISDKCCLEMKEKPLDKWSRENNKPHRILGLMRSEGGRRHDTKCKAFKGDKLSFHPLAIVTKEWEEWFIQEYDVKLCKLYYEPYNFERTGCKGCPFSLELGEQLAVMDRYGMENERRQCEFIWQPVYEEYRRIGYRLKREEQTKLF